MNGVSQWIVAVVALGLFMLLNAVVGVRLLWLARRTRERPELFLGLGHLLGGALGWALVLFSGLFPRGSSGNLALLICGLFCLDVANGCIALFIWRVFAPGRPLAAVAWTLLACALVADFVHNGLWRREFAPPFSTFWFWPGSLGRGLPWPWLALTTGASWRKLRRRLPLGLVDRATVNRMGLVFAASTLVVAFAVVVTSASLVGWWERAPLAVTIVSSLLLMPSALCTWLAFVPPRRYLAWLERAGGETG